MLAVPVASYYDNISQSLRKDEAPVFIDTFNSFIEPARKSSNFNPRFITMKPRSFALSLLILTPGILAAQTTIIDGTAPGYVLNGSFESNSGDNTLATGWEVDPSYTFFTGQDTNDAGTVRNNLTATDGSFSLPLGRRGGSDSNEVVTIATNTGFDISLNDIFSLTFDAAGAFGWDSGEQLDWTLFYTSDDTAGGTVTELATASVLPAPDPGTGLVYATFASGNVTIVDSGAVGRDLWLALAPGANVDAGSFSRVDQVNLTVIPEPSTVALLGGSLALVVTLVRRRR